MEKHKWAEQKCQSSAASLKLLTNSIHFNSNYFLRRTNLYNKLKFEELNKWDEKKNVDDEVHVHVERVN